MNWLVFLLLAYAAAALESGLRGLLVIGSTTPSFLIVLAVYVGLLAPASVVPWAWLVLGVVADLQPGPLAEGPIVGPMALGYLVGGVLVLQLRKLLFRESALALVACVLAAGAAAHLVAVALLTARGWGWILAEPIAGFSPADQLATRALDLVYSALLALPVGLVLLRTTKIWGFASRGRGDRHF
ncbi:MAG: hypothetical protein WD009_00100 [Phycisphaeraceae bacterium]